MFLFISLIKIIWLSGLWPQHFLFGGTKFCKTQVPPNGKCCGRRLESQINFVQIKRKVQNKHNALKIWSHCFLDKEVIQKTWQVLGLGDFWGHITKLLSIISSRWHSLNFLKKLNRIKRKKKSTFKKIYWYLKFMFCKFR